MKHLHFLLLFALSLKLDAQDIKSYSGYISEKVEISTSSGSIRFIEEYNPPRSYQLVMKPGIIIWKLNNQTITYIGVKPGYRDQNGTLVFPVKRSNDGPLWVFMITKDGDKMFLEMDVDNKAMRGYYLK